MTSLAPMAALLQLPHHHASFGRRGHFSGNVDSLHLSDSFWDALQLETPTKPCFDAALHDSPVDEKTMRVVNAGEAMTMLDDPIVAFETLDCYSPNRPTFSPVPPYDEHNATQRNVLPRPCPFGEPAGACANPAPTLASIRYEKPSSRQGSPWSGMMLRPTRFRKNSSARQQPSMLALASAFMDTIARLTRSRTSMPAQCARGPMAAVQIMESEVLVNVIQDGKRAGVCEGQSLCSEFEQALERLHLPPLSAVWPSESEWSPADSGVSIDREEFGGRGRSLIK